MRRRLWLLLCALGVLGTAACGAGGSKANAAAKSKVVKSSAAAAGMEPVPKNIRLRPTAWLAV